MAKRSKRRVRGVDKGPRKKRTTKPYSADTPWNVVNTRTHKQIRLDPKYSKLTVFREPGPKKVIRRKGHAHRYHVYSKNYGKTHYRAPILGRSKKAKRQYNEAVRIAKSGR